MNPRLPWYTNSTQPFQPGHGLGRKVSPTQQFLRVASLPVTASPFTVNRRLDLPYQYIPSMDQGSEGACTGFAWSWAMSILNRRLYAARKLYLEAQYHDPWPETPPEEGTSIVAGALVLRDQGHWRFARGVTFPLAAFEGIQSFRAATTVDEIRFAISQGVPVVLGINWHENFDRPEWIDVGTGGPRWWIGRGELGAIRGGHAICCFGARDDIQAVALVNSWGRDYPIVYLPYTTLQLVLNSDGECVVPVDRVQWTAGTVMWGN